MAAFVGDTSKYRHAPKREVNFIKAREEPQILAKSITSLLHTASDWWLHVDMGKQLKFPQHIVTTSLCPDMIITII